MKKHLLWPRIRPKNERVFLTCSVILRLVVDIWFHVWKININFFMHIQLQNGCKLWGTVRLQISGHGLMGPSFDTFSWNKIECSSRNRNFWATLPCEVPCEVRSSDLDAGGAPCWGCLRPEVRGAELKGRLAELDPPDPPKTGCDKAESHGGRKMTRKASSCIARKRATCLCSSTFGLAWRASGPLQQSEVRLPHGVRLLPPGTVDGYRTTHSLIWHPSLIINPRQEN